MDAELPPKQALFVRRYLVHLNATKAAIEAGYSAKTADVQGPRLLGNVRVAAAIKAGTDKLAKKLDLTAEKVLTEIGTIAFDPLDSKPVDFDEDGLKTRPEIRASDKLKALELLGKHLKLFTDKVEHKHSFDDMTDEQLEQRFQMLVAKGVASVSVSVTPDGAGDE